MQQLQFKIGCCSGLLSLSLSLLSPADVEAGQKWKRPRPPSASTLSISPRTRRLIIMADHGRPPPESAATAAQATSVDQDNATPRDWIKVMPKKPASKYSDPCAHAAAASMKCLEDNGYDRSRCMKAFED